MSKRIAAVRLAAGLGAAVIALTACGGGTTPPSTPAPEDVAVENPYPGSGYVDKARDVSDDVDAYHDSLNDAFDNLP